MLHRVESEEPGALQPAQNAYAEPVVPAAAGLDMDAGSLPQEHPKWVRDSLAVSQRARDLIARLRPVAIRIFTFWDHRLRQAFVGGHTVRVDPSGCYRID